ncbi:MAG: hypothetical protein MJ078_04240 [Clostridia bacterium]|nr:hypothetical protein [Clostridia bacterium]
MAFPFFCKRADKKKPPGPAACMEKTFVRRLREIDPAPVTTAGNRSRFGRIVGAAVGQYSACSVLIAHMDHAAGRVERADTAVFDVVVLTSGAFFAFDMRFGHLIHYFTPFFDFASVISLRISHQVFSTYLT